MVERGVTHIILDTTMYTGEDTFELMVMQEQIIETHFWRQY